MPFLDTQPLDPSSYVFILSGPMLIGTFISLILHGVVLVQTFSYHENYKDDKAWQKACVWMLFAVGTVNIGLDVAHIYDHLVNKFGDVAAQAIPSLFYKCGPLTTGIIGLMVQLFFGRRIWILTHSLWAFIAIAALAVIECLAAIATSVAMFCMPDIRLTSRIQSVVIVWLIAAAIDDTLITVILVTFLKRHKTGSPPTDDVIDKIIRLTIQTGLLTALWAVADMVLYITAVRLSLSRPGNATLRPSLTGSCVVDLLANCYIVFGYSLSELYMISLLSSLNSRKGWTSSVESTRYIGGISRPRTIEFRDRSAVRDREIVPHDAATAKHPIMVTNGRQTFMSEGSQESSRHETPARAEV